MRENPLGGKAGPQQHIVLRYTFLDDEDCDSPLPRPGRAALPDTSFFIRRRCRGAPRGTRTAAVFDVARGSGSSKRRESDHPGTGGTPDVEAQQHSGIDRSAGDARIFAPKSEPGRPPMRPGETPSARETIGGTGSPRTAYGNARRRGSTIRCTGYACGTQAEFRKGKGEDECAA